MSSAQPLVGVSAAIRTVLEDVDCAARSDVKVLVTGESGVGKEVVAGLIHHRSRRTRGPFIAFNCAGVPDTLLASELFGHMRGSFTDASSDKRGYLEQANTGTIFMDEVGEMSLQMQALLLRFLESGEIQPVGSTERRRIHVDVRVITATNRRLLERISVKEFRDDLFYRLNVFHIDIPPLRERREDISVLLEHFFLKFSGRYGVPLPVIEPDAMSRLIGYDWPGNVRELRNVAERLLVRTTGAITTGSLPREILGAPQYRNGSGVSVRSRADDLFERVVAGGESFWKAVADPFLARDLTRDDLRTIVRRGLDLTNGSYKGLVSRFNMPDDEYKKFLSFLRKYQSHLPIQDFRAAHANLNGGATERAAGE